MAVRPPARRVALAAEILEDTFGVPRWAHELHDPVSTLVGTILSQNTNDRNSTAAYNNLRKLYPKWENVLSATEKRVAKAIHSGGLPDIKAKRILGALAKVRKDSRTGKISMEFLRGKPGEEVREYLLSIEGVGPKTAAIVMVFSLGIPAFPVDTHIYRVSKRLGFIPEKTSYDKAHELMGALVPDKLKASFHVNLIFLGRRVCHAHNPECGACLLRKVCPSAFNKKMFSTPGALEKEKLRVGRPVSKIPAGDSRASFHAMLGK
ncbi:G/T mismatches repair enzyme [uncultured archaeon]|nr:G/T mismatches repair enzyme [uncultured archaeon]